MASLSATEKKYLGEILFPKDALGYVLDFTDPTYSEFFHQFNVDINSQRYRTYGDSKAKRLRAFWEQDPDNLVGKVLNEMLDLHKVTCELNNVALNLPVMEKCAEIVRRLTGIQVVAEPETINGFLKKDFGSISFAKLPVEESLRPILKTRLNEALATMNAKAHLSTIFMCGSILEGALLGVSQSHPSRFNKSRTSPKDDDGKVLPFHKWSLAQLIDTACDIQLIGLDVKKFSHALRDFRNYIHPYEQMRSGFSPDAHTARICLQVLKAALASLSKDRV
ncbi:MAG: hypothetical protein JKY60_04690 [Kordiimonadaceae bacterium]|nr:hypothetical protein [Kordiimonadaceae bacterium]